MVEVVPKMKTRACLLPLALLLTACLPLPSPGTRITLRAGENWEARAELVFAPEQAQLAATQIEQELNDIVAQWRAQGLVAEWRRENARSNGNTPYVITASGQGLDKLNATFFDNQAILYVDKASGFVVFRYVPGSSALSGTGQQTFTLVGGRILSSNGLQTDASTVIWSNPSATMEAVLTEAPLYPWLPHAFICAGAILLTVAAFGLVGLLRARGATLKPPAIAPRGPVPFAIADQTLTPVSPPIEVTAVSGPRPVLGEQEALMAKQAIEAELFQTGASATQGKPAPLPSPDQASASTLEVAGVVPMALSAEEPPVAVSDEFCSDCGTVLSEEAVFCPACGHRR